MELEAVMVLLVLAAVVLVVKGNMELHVTISELSWPPKPPWLVGSVGQKCAGKVAPKRRASLISENGEGEKVTVVDVDEEVVFLKIEKQEDEKGNLRTK